MRTIGNTDSKSSESDLLSHQIQPEKQLLHWLAARQLAGMTITKKGGSQHAAHVAPPV